MLSFNSLISNVNEKTKVDEYLLNFFNKKNFKEYEIPAEANKKQTKAIKTMFESKKEMKERIEEAFDYDPFCREAFFAYLMISEDVFVQLRFNAYYDEANNYGRFDYYQRECYLSILDFYVDFLLDIGNLTKAINVEMLIVKLTNSFSKKSVSRLSYAYFTKEDSEGFYRLYTEADFDAYEYVLCMVTLLKNDEDLKAQEVLADMFKNNKYGIYLDHVWDLDENDPEQKDFMNTIEDIFDDIKSYPTFFSWVNKTREKIWQIEE